MDEIAPLPPPKRIPTTYVHATPKESPFRIVRIGCALWALLTSTIRMLAGLVLSVVFAPILAPALLMLLPDCAFVRVLERVATDLVRRIASVANVVVEAGAKCDTLGYRTMHWSWLNPPIIRKWVSPLVNRACASIVTYDQPGRWMCADELRSLSATLYRIAAESMHTVPKHRLFNAADLKTIFANRIISVAYDHQGLPLGFSALCYLPSPYGADFVVHLGLTMITTRARGHRIQSPLISKCLTLVATNQCRLSYTITNIGASPSGIGAIADYFLDVYPHYQDPVHRTSHHLLVARHILRYYRHEFGCSINARFDEQSFVVHGSNAEQGGGSAAFIKEDGKPVSRHKNPACNAWCLSRLDLAAGDEQFMVGKVNLPVSLFRFIVSKRTFRLPSKTTKRK